MSDDGAGLNVSTVEVLLGPTLSRTMTSAPSRHDGHDDQAESEVAPRDLAHAGADAGSGADWLMSWVRLAKGCPRSGGAAPACRYPRRRASIGSRLHRRRHPIRAGVEIRPAATVMLVRDAPGPSGGTRARGAHGAAQPALGLRGRRLRVPRRRGGSARRRAEAEAFCTGRTDAEASALLGFDSGGLAYWVAVVRETFEEAGLLLARRAGGPDAAWPASPTRRPVSPPSACGRQRRHAALPRPVPGRGAASHGGRRSTTSPTGSPPAARRAATTPASSWPPRRPARSPPTMPARPSPRCGSRPHDALARHRAGEIEIIFPTIRNLQAIGRFATSAALLGAAARGSSAVPAIEPRVVPDGNGMRIVLPGDPAYERGAGGRPRRRRVAAATSTRPCGPSPCRPTWRAPTPRPGPGPPDRPSMP